MPEIRFNGQVVIVTGASSGIGRAHALYLAQRGAKVLVNGRDKSRTSDAEATGAELVVSEIRARGGEAAVCHGDVSDPEVGQKLAAEALDRWGRIDVLIANAGFVRDRTFAKMPPEDFAAVMRTHFYGSVHCTRAVLPSMMARGYGRIVLTTSGAGFYGNYGQSNYSAAKLGVIGFMRTLRLEVARHGIRVNALAPIAATPMNESIMPTELCERLTTQSVAAAAAFLSSEQCQLNGETLVAGGGEFACIQFAETRGVSVNEAEISPEFIAAHWPAISDMRDAHVFADGSQAFAARFGVPWGK